MSKFKKGDRVRVRAGLPTHSAVVTLGGDRWLNIRFDGESAEVAYMDHELELVPKFDFEVGDKVTTPGWSATPERFVTVEWIGPSQFAGETHDGKKVVHDFASANSRWQKWTKTYHFPFKVGDRVRLSDGSWHEGLLVTQISPPDEYWWKTDGLRMYKELSNGRTWELISEPAPEPKPTVKKWLVTTEERAPREGETFVYATEVTEPYDTGFYRAECYFSVEGKRDVATSVQPLTNLNDWIVGGDRK